MLKRAVTQGTEIAWYQNGAFQNCLELIGPGYKIKWQNPNGIITEAVVKSTEYEQYRVAEKSGYEITIREDQIVEAQLGNRRLRNRDTFGIDLVRLPDALLAAIIFRTSLNIEANTIEQAIDIALATLAQEGIQARVEINPADRVILFNHFETDVAWCFRESTSNKTFVEPM